VDVTAVLQLLTYGNQLKRTARTGWVQRGVSNAESVAAHSYGVVYTALVLVQLVAEPVDVPRVLAMAALHDLPEALTTDIPTPAWRYLPDGVKTAVERRAMQEMLANTPVAPQWMALWEELHASQTAEARLVHDADKLEMYLQAVMYEMQQGNRQLAEFWSTPHTFYFPQTQAIYDVLRNGRIRPS
jgi:putative hydrolase of HD superfamily